MNAGTRVKVNIKAVSNILASEPLNARHWQTVARLLRQAADNARKIAKLAEAMERGTSQVREQRYYAQQ